MKKDMKKITIENELLKLKLNYNIIMNLLKILHSLSNMVNSLWLGLCPRPRWGSLMRPQFVSHRWCLDPTEVGTFDCCPTRKKWNDIRAQRKVILLV